jgi:hypothetical protein
MLKIKIGGIRKPLRLQLSLRLAAFFNQKMVRKKEYACVGFLSVMYKAFLKKIRSDLLSVVRSKTFFSIRESLGNLLI